MSKVWSIVCIVIVCGLAIWIAGEAYYSNSYKGAEISGEWDGSVNQHEVEDLLRANNVRCN